MISTPLLLTPVSWTSLGIQRWKQTTITYSIANDFCEKIIPNFLEDRFLSFHSINCDDIQWTLRRAFSAWEYNSDLIKFKHVLYNETRHGGINIAYKNVDEENVLGTATNFKYADDYHDTIVESRIVIDDSFCFYVDNIFCHNVKQFATQHDWLVPLLKAFLLTQLVIYSCILISLHIQSVCYHRTSRRRTLLTLGTMWVVFLPLLLWGVIFPCTSCHDFNILMTHEIGHSLGFGHTDENQNLCGCANVSLCDPDQESILVSKIDVRPNACLSQSDADGLHQKYNESCKPVVCFPSASESYMGYTRAAVSIFIPTLASLAVGGAAHFTERRLQTAPST